MKKLVSSASIRMLSLTVTLAMVCVLAAMTSACTTYPTIDSLAPVVPVLNPEEGSQYPFEIAKDEWCQVVNFNLPDAQIRIWDVYLKYNDVIVEKPLQIWVNVKLNNGTARFSPGSSFIYFTSSSFDSGDRRRLLRPSKVEGYRQRSGSLEPELLMGRGIGGAEIVIEKPILSARLADANTPNEPYVGYLYTFDVSRENILPLVFQLGDIEFNGTMYSFPEITFEPWSGVLLRHCR